MESIESQALRIHRRTFLGQGAAGLGLLALNSLLSPRLLSAAQKAAATGSKGVVNPLHFPPKAKRVIFLYQAGGPSHLETLRSKAEAGRDARQADARVLYQGTADRPIAGQAAVVLWTSAWIQTVWQSRGIEMCELFPHIGSVADDVCIIRSMWTEQINHDPAHTLMNTGSIITGRPSMGSWVLYGLGIGGR